MGSRTRALLRLVRATEWHYRVLEVTISCAEGCFSTCLHAESNNDNRIAQVKLGEDLCANKSIQHLINAREWISILNVISFKPR